MDIKSIIRETRDRMDKSVKYLENEMRGIRTGRATTALIDFLKVDYYGSPTELRELAAISVTESTQLLVKPFDPTSKSEIVKALETSNLGLNPMVDGATIRINVPSPSRERRLQLVAQVKKMAEETRISIRNERRDANKHVDQLVKDKSSSVSEDQGKDAKDEVEELTKKHVHQIDEINTKKAVEIETV